MSSSWQLTLRQTLAANSNAIRFGSRMGLLTLSGGMFALVPLLAQLEAGPRESDLTWIFITCVIVGSSGAICGVGIVKGFDRAVGTTCGAVVAIACAIASSYMGAYAPYFVGVCILVYCTTVFFMMEKHKAALGVHTYALMLSSLTFGLVLLDSYKVQTEDVWRAGVWRTGCIIIGCVLSLLFIAFFFPIRTLAVVHDTYCVILRQEAELLREIIHARARGDVKHSLRSIIYEGKDDDDIHKKYITIMSKITSMSALIPNAQWESAYFSLDFDRRRLGDQRSYRLISARLRRLATHVIVMDEQLRIKPTPLPPNKRTANKLERIGNHIHDLLVLIAVKLERLGRVSSEVEEINLESSVMNLDPISVREAYNQRHTFNRPETLVTPSSAKSATTGTSTNNGQSVAQRGKRVSINNTLRHTSVASATSATSTDGMLDDEEDAPAQGDLGMLGLDRDEPEYRDVAESNIRTHTRTGVTTSRSSGWETHSTVDVQGTADIEDDTNHNNNNNHTTTDLQNITIDSDTPGSDTTLILDNDQFDAIWSAKVREVVERMRVVAEGLVRKSGKQRFEDSTEHSERKELLGRKYSVHDTGAWVVAGQSVAEAWRDQAGDLFTALVVNATVQCMMVLQDAELLGELAMDSVLESGLGMMDATMDGLPMAGPSTRKMELHNIPEQGE